MATSRHNNVHQPGRFAVPLTPGPVDKAPWRTADADKQELRMATLERERREVQQELFDAAQVQRRLSGPRRLRRGRFEIASEVFPVRHLAGDFVSAMDIGARTWIAVGDIAGKGLAAAMWFTHMVSLIRCYGAADPRAAAVMTALNADLCGLQPDPPLTSVVLVVLDCATGQVEYSNGGHPAPLVLRRDGGVERLDAGGPLLGVVGGATYESAHLELCAGDQLLGCTDGVMECRNADDEEFGDGRLLGVAREHAGDSAQQLLYSVLGAVQDFAGHTPRQDDISVLVVSRKGEFCC